MKILKYGLIGLGACLLATLGGVGILALTFGNERGTGWLFATLQSRPALGLSIAEVTGTLLDGVVLTDVQLVLGGGRLEAASVAVRWNVDDLLVGSVVLDELRIAEARYRQSAAPADSAPTGLPWPWRIVVRRGAVDNLVVESRAGTVTFEGTAITLAGQADRLVVHELATRVGGFALQAHGELRLGEVPQVDGAFVWSWASDAFPARGSGTLTGPLDGLELHHELTEPFRLLTSRGWSGSLEALDVERSLAGDWRLTAPVAVSVEGRSVSIGDFCLAQSSARVCGSAQVSGTSDDRIELAARRFELGSLAPLLRGALTAEGTYDAALHWVGPPDEPRASVSVVGGATRAVVQTAGAASGFGFDRLRLDATLQSNRIAVEGSVDAGSAGAARVDARIDDAWGPNPGIRGSRMPPGMTSDSFRC